MRSAKAPTIRPGVITAKVSWNRKNAVSGMASLIASTPTPRRNALSSVPTKECRFTSPASMPLVPKARL